MPKSIVKKIIGVSIKRFLESKTTIAYCILLATNMIISILLESFVVYANLKIYSTLQQIDPNTTISTSIHPSDSDTVALGLRRLKNEGVFIILFSLFQFLLGIDAMLRQSVIQLIAHVTSQFLAVLFASIQIIEIRKRYKDADQKILNLMADFSMQYLMLALKNGIGLVILCALLSIVFAYLCYQLFKQFGWNIYKRIGADVDQQSRFQLVQVLFLLLKLDAFFQLVLCVFYAVVMTQEQYFSMWDINRKKMVGYIVHILITLVLIPILLCARHGVISENATTIALFQVAEIIMVFDLVLVLVDSAGTWIFWILAVCVAIVLCIATIIFGFLVAQNFNEGLKPHLQGVFESNGDKDIHNEENPLKKEEWLIDEEYTQSHLTFTTSRHSN
ncbi:unnamed protein product [Rhizopus stolonifer]